MFKLYQPMEARSIGMPLVVMAFYTRTSELFGQVKKGLGFALGPRFDAQAIRTGRQHR